MKILLLEDDVILNEIIEEYLVAQEHTVVSALDGNEAQEYLYSQTFDLLLLDINVPDVDGLELLSSLRKRNIRTPAIFITSLQAIEDVQKGFEHGCDDYIRKPFELKELTLRINNLQRLLCISVNQVISIDENTTLDGSLLTLTQNGETTHLAKKEYEVLAYLLKNKNKPISQEELTLNLYSYEGAPEASTIRTYIKNLRKILGKDKITNIRGVGYRFND